ncbi:GNAT family N-acetyltransferase [Plastoroseomonas hellenica]|uniref:GNAT family N-acetyltransferase n=1 Tax=Plastoroseomonas hellenica TaxID=2687306 RepID=UPI001BA6E4CC|nr:GNAT family N-acetyltransferase [Plastoroseomonas hellenica]MBR0643006.1 GNAT family N-acetyltransferase [Plastoroseomonas hellenica]
MALTDVLTPHRLDAAALPAALALSAEAGWNQVTEDWRIFLDHGAVHGVSDASRLLGTAAILPYSGFGWVSMVLVTAAARGRGVGTLLLRHAIAALTATDQVPVLDATPAGERIYHPLGFRPVFPLMRWRGEAGGAISSAEDLRPIGADDLPAITALDARAFGAMRSDILAGLWRRAPAPAVMLAGGDGFVLARPGRQALQIGPLVAPDEVTARRLLAAALARVSGPVLVDLPTRWDGLARLLQDNGFRQERPFLRMALERREAFGDPDRLFAVAGPELG